ncbi:hypothetical protein OAF65_00420 [Verrucomicrobiales bacterium]|nr:hypothetical protein [Verrucomicrobiales bacterium]MDB4720153.1 hypothetical protein [Verrucomicrobiales bacterium]
MLGKVVSFNQVRRTDAGCSLYGGQSLQNHDPIPSGGGAWPAPRESAGFLPVLLFPARPGLVPLPQPRHWLGRGKP